MAIDGYSIPEDSYQEWQAHKLADFVPTPRQALAMCAVEAAVAKGLFYTDDVLPVCAAELGVPCPAKHAPGQKVEYGEFGMDMYYARGAIEARKAYASEAATKQAMQLKVGDKLGTLMFNDFKRVTGCEVTALVNGDYKVSGKRGSSAYIYTATGSQLRNAIERAFERKVRADNYDQWLASRHGPTHKSATQRTPIDNATQDLFATA